MRFNNPIIGEEALIRTGIKSQNYEPSVAGWRIARDGDAEFNNITARGTILGSRFTTAESGAHIEINPELPEANFNPQRIIFYETDETTYSRVEGYDGPNYSAIRMSSGRDESVSFQTAYLDLDRDTGAWMFWGNPNITDPDTGAVTVPENITASVVADDDAAFIRGDRHVQLSANWLALVSDPSEGPATVHGVWLRSRDSSGNIIVRSNLQYTNEDGTRRRPSFRPSEGNIRLLFDDESDEMQVLNWAGSAWRPIAASAFPVRSTRESKHVIRELSKQEAQKIINSAPSSIWKYIDDHHEQTHCGPMADDLPEWMVDKMGRVDIRDLIGVLWRAAAEEE